MTKSTRKDLRRFLINRRSEIDPDYTNLAKFSRSVGITYRTLQRVESEKTTHNFSSPALRSIESAYQVPLGSIEKALAGGPLPDPVEIARLPTPPGRPPAEEPEPHLKLRGLPLLHPGEELTAWLKDDGRLHCKFSTEDGVVITAPVPGDKSTEDIVKRMRMMVDLSQL